MPFSPLFLSPWSLLFFSLSTLFSRQRRKHEKKTQQNHNKNEQKKSSTSAAAAASNRCFWSNSRSLVLRFVSYAMPKINQFNFFFPSFVYQNRCTENQSEKENEFALDWSKQKVREAKKINEHTNTLYTHENSSGKKWTLSASWTEWEFKKKNRTVEFIKGKNSYALHQTATEMLRVAKKCP